VTFVDTGFLFVLVSSKDEHHASVVDVFNAFRNVRLRDPS
jgi:predicted nucleic acid-binding protein